MTLLLDGLYRTSSKELPKQAQRDDELLSLPLTSCRLHVCLYVGRGRFHQAMLPALGALFSLPIQNAPTTIVSVPVKAGAGYERSLILRTDPWYNNTAKSHNVDWASASRNNAHIPHTTTLATAPRGNFVDTTLLCPTCGQVGDDKSNCCSSGGAWEGMCGEGGQYTHHDGYQACNGNPAVAKGHVECKHQQLCIGAGCYALGDSTTSRLEDGTLWASAGSTQLAYDPASCEGCYCVAPSWPVKDCHTTWVPFRRFDLM